MNKIRVPIRGMHCRSCEILVEGKLKKVPGVSKVSVNHKSGQAEVFYGNSLPSGELIKKAVADAGYDIGQKDKLSWLSTDKEVYLNLIKGAVILLILYLIANQFGLFKLGIDTSNSGLLVALGVGLVAGLSTCMALVGGLVLGLSARHAELHPEISAKQKFTPHLYFNLGRIVGFAFLGGIIGLLGSAFRPSPGVLGFMTVIIGGVMMFLGLKLIEVFPILKDKNISLPTSIAKALGLNKEQKEYSHKGAFITGALTFFLPCGFTQAMQLYAVSTGSFFMGALIMGLFATGTSLGLLSIGGLASVFKGRTAKIFFAGTGIAVILLGWFNIANGSQLIGLGSAQSADVLNNATDVQEVRMTQSGSGYLPNQFTVEKGKKVRWIINSTDQFSCASSLVMPKYGISQSLQKGENIIEFVPTETGEIPFSCSMGMYRGKFIVVDAGSASVGSVSNVAAAGSAGSGTCGVGGGGGCGCMGGAAKKPIDPVATNAAATPANEQLIQTVYTSAKDISPNKFTVKKGQPVKFEIDVKDNGSGCMSSIMVQSLYNQPQPLIAGNKIVMTFTPTADQVGDHLITCAMGVPRGIITVTN